MPNTRQPFIGYDGESVSGKYVLLANSLGEHIESSDRLSTDQCLSFLARPAPGFRVFFAGHYDVSHICADIPPGDRSKLFHGIPIKYGRFALSYFPRKIFTITSGKVQYRYFDVWGFFQGSFEKAISEHLKGEDFPLITIGKAIRGDFAAYSRKLMRDYNALECRLLARIMERVRDSVTLTINGAEVCPRSWHGAGAVASVMLKKLPAVKAAREIEMNISPQFKHALVSAFYGGRIELLKVGTPKSKKIYQYDINSAYPAAFATAPELTPNPDRVQKFQPGRAGVYLVEWYFPQWTYRRAPVSRLPGPLPWRASDGYVSFPAMGRGWYWADEIAVLLEYYKPLTRKWGGSIQILDGYAWDFKPAEGVGDLVNSLYTERARLKKANDPRQLGIKLGLNSMYGKLAQHSTNAPHRVIAWAGYITSKTRATLLRAGLQHPGNVIGFATDSLISTRPLNLDLNKDLGGWSLEMWDGVTALMPGLGEYRREGETYLRSRGFRIANRGSVDFDEGAGVEVEAARLKELLKGQKNVLNIADVTDKIARGDEVKITVPLFVSHTLADAQPNALGPYRLQVLTEGVGANEKTINVFKQTKRLYDWFGMKHPHSKNLMSHLWGSRLSCELRGEKTIVESYPSSVFDDESTLSDEIDFQGEITDE